MLSRGDPHSRGDGKGLSCGACGLRRLGFNPDEPGTEYKSTQDEAKRLGDYAVERCGGKIDILYGVSYGTFVLMDVLAD